MSNEDSGPISFADLGIPAPRERTTDTILGKSRRFSDLETKEIIFLVVSMLSLLSTLAITIYTLTIVSRKDPDFTFALIILVNTSFCIYYVIHGVLNERPYELFILVTAVFIVLLYLIINYAAGKHTTVKLVRLILSCVFGPPTVILGLIITKQYYVSGNLVFQTIGANSELQGMCKMMYLFFGLLKIDLQLAATMIILILNSVNNIDTEDIVILSVGSVLAIAWSIIGYLGVRMENRYLCYVFWAASVLQPAYIIYKVVRSAQTVSLFPALAAVTFTCAFAALAVRVGVVAVLFFVYRNFNQGLKDKVYTMGKNLQTSTKE